jgi:hypothetical protein
MITDQFLHRLPISVVRQLGPGADEHGNDCGIACTLGWMQGYKIHDIESLSVDKAYNRIEPCEDTELSGGDLITLMATFGLSAGWRANLTVIDLFEYLSRGQGVIALIWYEPLVTAGLTERTQFKKCHFVAPCGIDGESVLVMDPYREKRNLQSIPFDIWNKAWMGPGPEIMPICGAVIISRSIYGTTPIVPITTGNVTPGEYKTTGYLYVRDKPASDGVRLLIQLPKNQVVQVEDVTEDGRWAFVNAPKAGWVDTKWLIRI